MATNKQIDAIFLFIKKKTNLSSQINDNYIWGLYINRTPELEIDLLLFHDILKKLIKDGYLQKSPDNMYHLTVDGRKFKGYVSYNRWYKRLFRNNYFLYIFTAVIAAVIAGIIIFFVSKLIQL